MFKTDVFSLRKNLKNRILMPYAKIRLIKYDIFCVEKLRFFIWLEHNYPFGMSIFSEFFLYWIDLWIKLTFYFNFCRHKQQFLRHRLWIMDFHINTRWLYLYVNLQEFDIHYKFSNFLSHHVIDFRFSYIFRTKRSFKHHQKWNSIDTFSFISVIFF